MMLEIIVYRNLAATAYTAVENDDKPMIRAFPSAIKYNLNLLKEFKKRTKGKRGRDELKKRVPRLFNYMAKEATAVKWNVPVKLNFMPDFRRRRAIGKSLVFLNPLISDTSDFARANVKRVLAEPANYTWHHHEVVGIMELVHSQDQNPLTGKEHRGR